MTRAQAIGVLAISLFATAAAVTSLVSGVITLVDRGPFAAMPALVVVPLVLGGVAYFALRTGMAWLARSGARLPRGVVAGSVAGEGEHCVAGADAPCGTGRARGDG